MSDSALPQRYGHTPVAAAVTALALVAAGCQHPPSGPDGGAATEEATGTVVAQRYGGTFTSTEAEFVSGSTTLELAEYQAAPFTLWIGEDGYPALLEHTSGDFEHTLTFVDFSGEAEVDVSAPGDPAYG
ncbi:hypothetical protein [Nocardiopsis synnemataformans]|uniref:hypothetical protein n=1 Tax=Nocardiopsis synnemataformans TaxID=61305 RepID=UPI003EBF7D13